MDIKEIEGDILDTAADVILHVVNCQGAMSSGISFELRKKWPIVFDTYINWFYEYEKSSLQGKGRGILGDVCLAKVNDFQYVANLFAQEYYGSDGKKYIDYDALKRCLKTIAILPIDGMKIAIPHNMGCGLAGGDWNVVMTIINDVFKSTDIAIEIVNYNKSK